MSKIAIIGAGIAGLAAGHKLKEQKHEVVVFEAKDRIGGRILTDHKFANFPVELGAEFIHGKKASSVPVLKQLHESMIDCGGFENFQSFVGGHWLSSPKLNELYPSFSKAIDLAFKKLPEALKQPRDISVRRWTEKLRVPNQAQRRVAAMFANPYLARPEELSIKEVAHEHSVETAGDENLRVSNGYDRLIQHFSKGLKIFKNTPVDKISLTKTGIKIESGKNHFTADKVIVTVPLSILQSGKIKFDPILSHEKTRAIESLRMGQVSKVILKFRKAFWSPKASLMIGGKHVGAWWSPAFKRTHADAIFTGFAVGKSASLKNLEQTALEDLTEMYGPQVKNLFMKSYLADWKQTPWIEGGYSFVPVGAFGMRQALAKPIEDRIYFAGEATAFESNPATVHGALDSGLRAANEILNPAIIQ